MRVAKLFFIQNVVAVAVVVGGVRRPGRRLPHSAAEEARTPLPGLRGARDQAGDAPGPAVPTSGPVRRLRLRTEWTHRDHVCETLSLRRRSLIRVCSCLCSESVLCAEKWSILLSIHGFPLFFSTCLSCSALLPPPGCGLTGERLMLPYPSCCPSFHVRKLYSIKFRRVSGQ